MKRDFEQIRDKITATAASVRVADGQAAQREQEIRDEYSAAKVRKAAALEAGNMDEYRAAGMEAEARRLDLEFIEGLKQKGPKPGATVEDDSRVMAALLTEHARIYGELLERVKKQLTEISDDCAGVLKQFAALDSLAETWGRVVMRKGNPDKAVSCNSRAVVTGLEGLANGQIERFKYMKKKV